jgi:two-component system chemotaxis sensor kinase CheA
MTTMKSKKSDSLKDFVAEAEEILDGLDQCLLQIDSAENKTQVKPEVINALFRGAHTLKGISGAVGLDKISKLSHTLEEMLDRLRLGKLSMSEVVITTLMQGVEVLRQLVQSVQVKGDDGIDIHPLFKKIEEVVSAKATAPSQNPLEQMGISTELLKVLTEYETHRLTENIKQGRHIIELKAHFDLQSFDKDLSRLMSLVQKLGEVITTLPSSGISPDKGIEFNIVLGAEEDLESVKAHLPGDKVVLKEIGRRPSATGGPAEPAIPSTQGPGEAAATVKSLSQSIRVDITKLDSLLNVVGELVLNKAVINQIGKEMMQTHGLVGSIAELFKASQELDRKVTELQEGLIEIRMVPVGQIFERLTLAVRKLSRELGKEVNLLISGEETRLDKSMVEAVADPLLHLIRNALDHGIESKEERRLAGKPEIGTIHLSAVQRGNTVAIEVTDDGRGIDLEKVYQKALQRGIAEKGKNYSQQELLNFLFLPGFSTASRITEVSGRGVGLDVVSKNLARLNSMVDIETTPGKGAKFIITLPITMVIIKALIIRVGNELYAIPLNAVSESLMVNRREIKTIEQREVVQLRSHTLSLLHLSDIFSLPPKKQNDERLYVIVVGLAEKRIGLVVDSIEGQQEIVIKSIGETLKSVPGIAGATELGNRRVILVLDVGALIEEATRGKILMEQRKNS